MHPEISLQQHSANANSFAPPNSPPKLAETLSLMNGEWLDPIPLAVPALKQQEPFPISALGPDILPAVEAFHKTTNFPYALIAPYALASATISVQGHYDVRVSMNRAAPLPMFFAILAESSEGKSPTETAFFATHRDVQKRQKDEHKLNEIPKYNNALAAYDKAKRNAESKILANASQEDIEAVYAKLGLPPTPMPGKNSLYVNVTEEALCRGISKNSPSCAQVTSEGGIVTGGHSMSGEKLRATIATYSDLLDGKLNPTDRITRDEIEGSDGKRFSLCLGTQPESGRKFFKNPDVEDQGFGNRAMITEVPRQEMSEDDDDDELDLYRDPGFCNFHNNVKEHLEKPLPLLKLRDGKTDPYTLSPIPVPLSSSAKSILKDFRRELERSVRPGEKYEQIRAAARKAKDTVAKIACVLTVFPNAHASGLVVQDAEMKNACTIMRWYLEERMRVLFSGSVDPSSENAQRILDWLKCKDRRSFIPSDIASAVRFPGLERHVNNVHPLLKILGEHRWIRFTVTASETVLRDGKKVPKTMSYDVNPKLFES